MWEWVGGLELGGRVRGCDGVEDRVVERGVMVIELE